MLCTRPFRGKTEKGYWVYGSLVNGIRQYDNERIFIIYPEDTKFDGRCVPCNYEGNIVDMKTVGQLVSNFDKNRNAIFESDIVDIWDEEHDKIILSGAVVINSCMMEYKGRIIPLKASPFDIEVIGNIFDNPYLVSNKDKNA